MKEIVLTDDVAAHGRRELVLNPKALGPRLGGATQEVIGAHKRGDWEETGDGVRVGSHDLVPGEFDFRLVSDSDGAAATLPRDGGIVVLDTAVTPELELEGVARDLIRRVQQERRDAGLDVSDRIRLTVGGPADVLEALEVHRDLVAGETLALEVLPGGAADETLVSVERVAAE